MGLIIRRHADASAFLASAEGWLLRSEAEHNLVLGLCHRLRISAAGFEPPIYLATVERAGEVVGCAFRTPPYKLGVTRMPDDALPLLAEDVAGVYAELPAVLGPEREARAFATLWGERQGIGVREGMRQRIYQLERVRRPEMMPQGELRAAQAEHVDLVAEWLSNFASEAGIHPVDARRKAEEQIAERALFFWDDGRPRSMAAVAGETPHGARIGYVYTPPEWRGRGYASACTAELSRRTLESGRQFCFLYTDLANPTSNAIYQRIGYQRVCDVVDWEFVARPG